MKKNFLHAFYLFFILVFSTTVQALPQWNILPNESMLTFTGTQNGAPASGRFKKFTGDISVDPKHIATGKVHLVIDMSSVSTSYSEFASTLKSTDWFDVALFPQAIFDATQFKQIGANQYQAVGTLTIRGKTTPVTLRLNAQTISPTKMRVTGDTIVKRSAFGIGTGEWADTNTVKDEVKVEFTLVAEEKAAE